MSTNVHQWQGFPAKELLWAARGLKWKKLQQWEFFLQLFGAVAKGGEGQIFAEDVQHLKAGGAIVLKSATGKSTVKTGRHIWNQMNTLGFMKTSVIYLTALKMSQTL